jgi:peptide/nickel transport system substrate-binding protein
MYGEMQRLIREEGGVVIPVFVNHVMAATTKIKFNKISGLKDLDEYRVAERWWFE